MKVSIVVPSKGCRFLNYLLSSLRNQVIKPHEVILVVRDCNIKAVERLCSNHQLSCIIIEQNGGYVTTAYNIGKRAADGDVILFTDDDAIAPKSWVKKYIKAFIKAPKDVACISSRDVYVKLDEFRITPTADDYPHTRLYRWFVRTWLEPPIEVLKEYRWGVYISKDLNIVHGPYLPNRACLSLPYRGVNMGFRGEVKDVIEFPEHPKLRRALGFEQYVGLQLVLKGWRSIYVPNNPILHIFRKESLSRGIDEKTKKEEIKVMKSAISELIQQSSKLT